MPRHNKSLSSSYASALGLTIALVIALPLAFTFARLEHPLYKALVFCALIAFFYVLAVAIAERMSKPIRILAHQAKTLVNHGKLEQIHFEVEHAPIEIRELAQSLNSLSQELEQTALQAQNNEQLQKRFVSDVSHELKTPLTAIKGTAELLLDDPEMPLEDREHFLQIIAKEAERLNKMAQDLLCLTRIEESSLKLDELKSCSVLSIAKKAQENCQSLLDERQVQVVISGTDGLIHAEESLLLQVFINLIENASRFSPPKSCIDIQSHIIHANSKEARLVISIKDEGPGFGDLDPQLLFKRFYQNNPSRAKGHNFELSSGTGLGLSIVQSIVLAHAGTIEAYNNADKGACFTLSFPLV